MEKDGLSVRMPVEDGLGPVDNAAVLVDTEAVFIALYGWPPIPTGCSPLIGLDVRFVNP